MIKETSRIPECDDIPVLKVRLPDIDKAYVYPLCDLHFGDKGSFDEKKFRGYLQIISEVPEAFCLFNGDLINCGLPGGVGAEDFWMQSPLTPQEQNDTLVELVKEYDITDKILAIVGGSNHPGRAMKLIGHNYDKQFAQDLDLLDKYVDPLCMLYVGVGKKGGGAQHGRHVGSLIWYSLIITHGWAGGRLAGSSINATRDLGAIYAADCIITSHRHLDAGTKDEFYIPDYHNKCVTKMKRIYVSAGTFMKYAPYAMRKGMRPNGTGTPRIRLDGRKKDVHVSI
jgi:hypothetical protein